MAHTLEGYDGACSQIHGHSYRMAVTLCGKVCDDGSNPKYGMVMDFGELKRLVNEAVVDRYDHTLMIRITPGNESLREMLRRSFERVEEVDYQPTCENLVVRFAAAIRPLLPQGVALVSLKLHETANSYAEWVE